MKSIKILLPISFLTAIILMVSANAMGTTAQEPIVQPRYDGATRVSATLSITSSGRADVYGQVVLKPSYTADLTVTLRRDSGSEVKSWSSSGSGSLKIDKGYYVTSGHDYYTSVSVSVYDSDGTLVDSITKDSSIVSY